MGGLRRVLAGEGLSAIRAVDWNAVVALLEEKAATNRSASKNYMPSGRQLTTILCQNTTGVDLDRFSIVGFNGPTIDPTVNLDTFQDRYCINIVQATSDNEHQWGITQEVIRNEEFGELLISGVTCVQIDPGSDDWSTIGFALPNGSYSNLSPTSCGICRVLTPGSGTGPQWCLVNIG